MAQNNTGPVTTLTIKEKGADTVLDIGSKFENVFLSQENGKVYSLKEFYNYLVNFLTHTNFSSYSDQEPIADNINIWYDTTVIS